MKYALDYTAKVRELDKVANSPTSRLLLGGSFGGTAIKEPWNLAIVCLGISSRC